MNVSQWRQEQCVKHGHAGVSGHFWKKMTVILMSTSSWRNLKWLREVVPEEILLEWIKTVIEDNWYHGLETRIRRIKTGPREGIECRRKGTGQGLRLKRQKGDIRMYLTPEQSLDRIQGKTGRPTQMEGGHEWIHFTNVYTLGTHLSSDRTYTGHPHFPMHIVSQLSHVSPLHYIFLYSIYTIDPRIPLCPGAFTTCLPWTSG